MKRVVITIATFLFLIAVSVLTFAQVSAEPEYAASVNTGIHAAQIPADEEEIIEDIQSELDLAKRYTEDNNIRTAVDDIKNLVNDLKKALSSGDADAALKLKYIIARDLEILINQLPLNEPNLTSLAANVPSSNPLYDELVRIRAKIDKLIALERELPRMTPIPPPEIERPPEMDRLIVYSAKFLCGPAAGNEGVVRGTYSTAINVHNPNNQTIYLFKKVVISLREDEPRGKISKFRKVALQPDEAIEIDCVDISNLLGPEVELPTIIPWVPELDQPETGTPGTATPGTTNQGSTDQGSTLIQRNTLSINTIYAPVKFIKGFVVIYATAPLDVVGVYTGSTSGGFSLDIEQIPVSTTGVLPVPIPSDGCPPDCKCMTKMDAAQYGWTELCDSEPCGYDDQQIPLYCWRQPTTTSPGCPEGCKCMTKMDAAQYGWTELCAEEPCDYDDQQVPLYCWRQPTTTTAQCPEGCSCLSKMEAAAKDLTELCDDEPCGYDTMQNPLYCWKQSTIPTAQCPANCSCLSKMEAEQYGLSELCDDEPCGYDTMQNPLYCWKKATTTAQCPADCSCLTRSQAAQYGLTLLCQDSPCGTDNFGNSLYCWKKMPVVEFTCPTDCFCVTETEAKQNNYELCDGVRIQCGADASGLAKYCFQKKATTLIPLIPLKPLAPVTAAKLTLTPSSDSNMPGQTHTVTATVWGSDGNYMSGAVVAFTVTGTNSFTRSVTTNASGQASTSYTSKLDGKDTITAKVDSLTATAIKFWSSLK